ncbi:MAG: hypothetical protein WC386_01705 [Candidatus Paceibacterota bacterium]|jgi:archaellum component FlaC
MKKKDITIDELAMMVQRGFNETAKKSEMDQRFDGVDRRLDKVEKRLDRIEKLILADHKERIERLEMQVKELKELIAFN